jgi:hypothetical protein
MLHQCRDHAIDAPFMPLSGTGYPDAIIPLADNGGKPDF